MSGRVTLTMDQVAELRQAIEERERLIIDGLLQVPDYPPLPACLECGERPEQIRSTVEDPKFETCESAILINFAPCGHRFRARA